MSMNETRAPKQNSGRELAPSCATAALVGAVSGLAGGRGMAQFNRLLNNLSASPSEPLPYSSQEWDATSKISKACARRISGRRLSVEESKAAAAVVHYAIAGSTGVL